MANHVCNVDCKLITEGARTIHMMYAATPSTAAGRYQYDVNRDIYRMGKGARKAFRATGQDESRNVREWNNWRKDEPHVYMRYGLFGRRFSRELQEMNWLIPEFDMAELGMSR